jgi:hypothetical protein
MTDAPSTTLVARAVDATKICGSGDTVLILGFCLPIPTVGTSEPLVEKGFTTDKRRETGNIHLRDHWYVEPVMVASRSS